MSVELILGYKMYSFQDIYLSAMSVVSLGAAVYDFLRTWICPPIQDQVILTMDTLQLLPLEGTQLQRVEDFNASKFHIKELRIKDLHKNLCKKSSYSHVKPDSPKKTSAAEPAEPHGELHQSCLGARDADNETCEEDGVASVPQGSTLPDPSEAQNHGEISAAEEQPSNRTSNRKTRLPDKLRLDSNSFSDFPESYARYYRRSTSKSKVKHPRLKEKLDSVQPQFFEVPIQAHEVDILPCDTASSRDRIGLGSSKVAESCPATPSERKTPTRPLKQKVYSPSSSQRREQPSKQCRVTVAYSECMVVSTDTDLDEGPSKTPVTSSSKWKHSSPGAHTKEILPHGKRTLYNGFKGNTSTSGSKPLESKLKRTYNALEGILPVGWRLDSPDASVERIVSTEKIKIRESKLEGKKSRKIESKLNETKSKILKSESKRSFSAPQASSDGNLPRKWKYRTSDPSTAKRTVESEPKDEKYRTSESTGAEKKRRTLEGESKRKHSASNASGEDILPLNCKLTQEKSPLLIKWIETSNRTTESQMKEKKKRLKRSHHDLDGSTQKILPLKRKHSYCDASMAEIMPTEKKKTRISKLKDNTSKTAEIISKGKTSRITKTELKKISDGPDAKNGKPSRRARIPIRKLKGGYTSKDRSSDSERDTDGPGVSHPTFVAEMKYSNVVKCFWMGVPAKFCTRHLPDHDQFMVLQDRKGLKWEANYLARKKGLSGGWRRFALDHHLEVGDTVIFELVKPLKFLVHITKVSGGISPTTPNHQVRESPKKVVKPQASGGTKRVSSLESAHFSNRKRVNKDAEGKFPRKEHRSAGDKKSVVMEPVAKPNRLSHPGALKENRKDARKATDHHEYQNAPLTLEDSEGEEALKTKRRASLPKLKRLSKKEDEARDSNAGIDVQELRLTVYEEPAFVPRLEPQKAGPLFAKPFVSRLEPQKAGALFAKPGAKKKLRRVSYFYSTDEDQGNSISADSGQPGKR